MDGKREEALRRWLNQRHSQLNSGRPRATYGTLIPEATPETMSPFPGTMSPTPESSFQVHRVTVTVFREVDDFPTVPRTTLVPRDHISKHVSHPHKGRV